MTGLEESPIIFDDEQLVNVIAVINRIATEIDFIRCNLIVTKKYFIVFLFAILQKRCPSLQDIREIIKMFIIIADEKIWGN